MTRTRFRNRRPGRSFHFSFEGVPYHAVVNDLADGIGELFLDGGKVGTTAFTLGKEAAVLFSLARQHGAPLDVIRDALPRLADGSPAGPTGLALQIAGEGEP